MTINGISKRMNGCIFYTKQTNLLYCINYCCSGDFCDLWCSVTRLSFIPNRPLLYYINNCCSGDQWSIMLLQTVIIMNFGSFVKQKFPSSSVWLWRPLSEHLALRLPRLAAARRAQTPAGRLWNGQRSGTAFCLPLVAGHVTGVWLSCLRLRLAFFSKGRVASEECVCLISIRNNK